MGKAREDFRGVGSIWESCRSGKKERGCLSFVTHFRTEKSQNEAGPIGEPSKTKPSLVVGISSGSRL